MTLTELRARLKELVGDMDKAIASYQELAAKQVAAPADDADEATKNAYDEHVKALAAGLKAIEDKTKEAEQIDQQIGLLEAAERVRAKAAQPADAPIAEMRTHATVAEKLTTVEKVGIMVAAMAKAHLEDGSKGHRATFRCMDENGYGSIVRDFGAQQRALNAGGASAGGVLVPENMANEIIDVLRPLTTFIQGGPIPVPLIGGNYKVPAGASSATAGWRGEGQAIAKSQPTFKEINMSSKYVDALVPITNQLIRFSLPDVRRWVEMDMANVLSVEIDRAAYVGEGTAHVPQGITKIAGITEVTLTATGTSPTVAQIEADAASAELGMMNANLPMLGAKWVMNPRTFIHLQNMRDSNGNRYYPELQNANPTWRNKPVLVTTQVPANGGATTDESEIWLVAFGHVLFGQGLGITFNVSTEATVVTSGTSVSAFQNDLTYIKASAEADFDMKYLEAVSKIPNVRWGA